MSRKVVKSRFLHLHLDTNPGKLIRFEALHKAYVDYIRICVELMFKERKLTLDRTKKQTFFPEATGLTSQIEKNARDHAIQTVSSWAKAVYQTKIKRIISGLKKSGEISKEQAKVLYTVGKFLYDRPSYNGSISQENIDFYWKLLDEFGGNRPEIRDNFPMRLSEMTARLEDPEDAIIADYWLRISSLESFKSIWLPLVGNPYIKKASDVTKGILARKKNGRWRFEAVDKKEWVVLDPEDLPEDAERIGIDVGLNVLVATSNGDLYGADFKPKFDKMYKKIKQIRTNRRQQGLKTNSPRLEKLESRMSGMMKTEINKIVNDIILKHPKAIFVLEDMNLSGCSGQKRFTYRAVFHAFSNKAPYIEINLAYTSQECPSCIYVSRKNRNGIKFRCRCCGRKAHADWVGASGVLRRSWDKDITCEDNPSSVKATLRARYLVRRRGFGQVVTKNSASRLLDFSPSSKKEKNPLAPLPLCLSLTTGGSDLEFGTGTGSNLIPSIS